MITIAYGQDIHKTTLDALDASDILTYLTPSMSVGIKPNLVNPTPAWDGATTHPEVVEAIITFLRRLGTENISIMESSWVGDETKNAFEHCGYNALSKRTGVPLYCLKRDKTKTCSFGGLDIEVSRRALGVDFLINVPVLKAHCQTRLTCCVKNLKGCIPPHEMRRFHTLGLSRPIAALGGIIKTGYNVVDGICGDLSFEEGGNPVVANRILCGRDPFLIDAYCAGLIGYAPRDIGYLTVGQDLGLVDLSKTPEVTEINAEAKPKFNPKAQHMPDRFAGQIDESDACSACYSALIHALHKTGGRGKIHIGQGFIGKKGEGFGVGSCTRGFSEHVPGCPPKAIDIIRALGAAPR